MLGMPVVPSPAFIALATTPRPGAEWSMSLIPIHLKYSHMFPRPNQLIFTFLLILIVLRLLAQIFIDFSDLLVISIRCNRIMSRVARRESPSLFARSWASLKSLPSEKPHRSWADATEQLEQLLEIAGAMMIMNSWRGHDTNQISPINGPLI